MSGTAVQFAPVEALSGVQRQLRYWWERLRPEFRDAVLAQTAGNQPLPEWIAQSLLRAGVPLTLRAGFDNDIASGFWKAPAEVGQFLDSKRRLLAEQSARRGLFRRGRHARRAAA